MLFNLFNINSILVKKSHNLCKLISPSTPQLLATNHSFRCISTKQIIPKNHSHSFLNYMCRIPFFLGQNTTFFCSKRFYRPDRNIDWVGIKTRWRAKQILLKKKKLKNHPRVAMRFKLTRFGWESLQGGRNSRKFNKSRLHYKNKMRVKYLNRCDLKKLERQMPGFRLRVRDPPIDNNPNIRKIRRVIDSYFG